MQENKKNTKYAPAEIDDISIINLQNAKLLEIPKIKRLFNAIPNIFMVLNDKRQIIFTNKILLDFVKKDDFSDVIGKRPGEVLNCQHASESECGCGTTEFCRYCGAVNVILKSLNGNYDIQECRILVKDSLEALELRVWGTPLDIDNQHFSIFAVQDISNEKRRNVLERIFFHDIVNTASGIRRFAEYIKDNPHEISNTKDVFYNLATELLDEINLQRQISAAENNELEVFLSSINTLKIINEIVKLYFNHELAENKIVTVDSKSDNIDFSSDATLIHRILSNMMLNALESSKLQDVISIGCKKSENNIVFYIKNPEYMPEEIQMQIFQRSFSTKGIGRGLGTYSMKLLTEKYLSGKVYFNTSKNEGTTFYASIPL